MADVREKLVELLEKFVPTVWAEDCEGNRHPMCDDIHCAECITDRLIANGVTIQRWIPVTERLPEKGDKYLCIVKSCLFRGANYQTILGYDRGGFHDGCICMEDVTHWMPLPEPPKDK